MIVALFRHGPAGSADASRWPNDAERPLTARGIERTRLAARGLSRMLGDVTLVLTSPLARSRQTAELVTEILEPTQGVETFDGLAPDRAYRAILARLGECHSSDVVVLVGHEPQLGKLAGMLLFGAPSTALPIKKAGAAVITFAGPLRPGEGHLTAFAPPRLLRRLTPRRSRV